MSRLALVCTMVLLLLLTQSIRLAHAEDGAAPRENTGADRDGGGLRPEAERAGGSGEILRAETIPVEDERIRPAEVYQDVPVETEILTAEDLRRKPAIDAIDALSAIPGLVISSRVQGEFGAVRIDGLPPEYTELLVNGQRYSGENAEATDLGDLLFANVDRIEILRGPQALRYSSRAGGGVINVITREPPTDGWDVSALLGRGDQGYASYKASVAGGNATSGANLIYERQERDGFDDPFPGSNDPRDGLPTPFGEGSTYRTDDVYTTLVHRLSDRSTLRTRLGYRIRNEAFADDDDDERIVGRREEERWLGNVALEIDATEATRLFGELTIYHDRLETDVGRAFEIVDALTRLQLGAETWLEWGDTSHVVTVGLDVFRSAIALEEGSIPDSIVNPDLRPGSTNRQYFQGGAYLVTESEFTDWLRLEGGLRVETNSRFSTEVLPQVAFLFTPLRWDAERALKLRISAGRAALYPSLRDLYQPPAAQNGGAYFLAGRDDIRQETTWAVRASVEATPLRWLSGTVSGFYNFTEDRIRSTPSDQIQVGENFIPANPALCPVLPEFCADRVLPVFSTVFASANLDDLRSWGVEARLELRPWRWLEMQLGYTWSRTKLTDSNIDADELPNRPRHIVNGQLALTAPHVATQLTTRASWRDRALIEGSGTGLVSFVSDRKSRDAFAVDLRLLQPLEPWVGAEVDLFVDGFNLTDNRVQDSQQIRGRRFFVGIQGRWP